MGDELHEQPGPWDSGQSIGAANLGPLAAWRFEPPRRRWFESPLVHGLLFLLTVLTTLIVGARIALNCRSDLPPFDWDIGFFKDVLRDPSLLKLGMPFSFTLLGILLAHELGHYFTCRHYGLRASYPYFIPAPTLIGTMGAFIRIKSPVRTRRALLDVGLSGPLAGFIVALPALIFATLHCPRVAPPSPPETITLGNPLVIVLLAKLLRPGVDPAAVTLTPIGCATWVGLFATTLNLLPIGQLDGGHILYAALSEKHRMVSRGLFLVLVPLGIFCWAGWAVWAVLLLIVGLRHPMLMIPSKPLNRARKILALAAALLFLLTFIPAPFSIR